MQKQLEKEPKYINEQCQIKSCPYRWATHANYCEQYTRADEYKMPKVIKPSNPFTDVCWVSVLL